MLFYFGLKGCRDQIKNEKKVAPNKVVLGAANDHLY
jgi:hypothetical protein